MAAAGAEVAVEEDAADLQFPPEFEKADTKTLLISEGTLIYKVICITYSTIT